MANRSAVSCPWYIRGIATAGGSGYLRPAPGTWGSAVAGVLAAVLFSVVPDQSRSLLLLAAAFASVAGVWASGRYARAAGIEDPSEVVIDEVAGVWVALVLVPGPVAVACPVLASTIAVLVFRLYDIAKPWPLSRLERLPGGWGIMADDLAAGVFAGVMTAAVLG